MIDTVSELSGASCPGSKRQQRMKRLPLCQKITNFPNVPFFSKSCFHRFAPRDTAKWTLKEHLQNGSSVEAFFESETHVTSDEAPLAPTTERTRIDAVVGTELVEVEEEVQGSPSSSTSLTSSASTVFSSPLYLLYYIPWLPSLSYSPQWSLSSTYFPWVG